MEGESAAIKCLCILDNGGSTMSSRGIIKAQTSTDFMAVGFAHLCKTPSQYLPSTSTSWQVQTALQTFLWINILKLGTKRKLKYRQKLWQNSSCNQQLLSLFVSGVWEDTETLLRQTSLHGLIKSLIKSYEQILKTGTVCSWAYLLKRKTK